MKPYSIKTEELHKLPYGTVIKKNRCLYFKSRGLDRDIFTDEDGQWYFVTDLEKQWKSEPQVVFLP